MRKPTLDEFQKMIENIRVNTTPYDTSVEAPSRVFGSVIMTGGYGYANYTQTAITHFGEELAYRRGVMLKVMYTTEDGNVTPWFAVPTPKQIAEYDISDDFTAAQYSSETAALKSQIKGIGKSTMIDGILVHEAAVSLSPKGYWTVLLPSSGWARALESLYHGNRGSTMRAACDTMEKTIEYLVNQSTDVTTREKKKLLLALIIEAYGIALSVQSSLGTLYTALLPLFQARCEMQSDVRSATRRLEEARRTAMEAQTKIQGYALILRTSPVAELVKRAKVIRELSHPYAHDFVYDSTGRTLCFRTKEIEMHHPRTDEVYLCPAMSVELKAITGGVTFSDPEKSYAGFWSSHDMHPHISGNGNACLGTVGGVLTEAIQNQDWLVAVELVIRFLGQFDPDDSAGKYYVRFPHKLDDGTIVQDDTNFGVCSVCGEEVDEDYEATCDVCGAVMCGDCVRSVGDLYICSDCYEEYKQCDICGGEEHRDNFTDEEVTNIHGESLTVCDGCFDNKVQTCDVCGVYYDPDVRMEDIPDVGNCCPSCLAGFTMCPECDTWVSNEDISEDGLCTECAGKEVTEDGDEDETSDETSDTTSTTSETEAVVY